MGKQTFVNIVDNNTERLSMKMNLIDLISEKHSQVRRLAAERWKETRTEEISRTEEHLLNKAARNDMTVSETARNTGISRQAVHRCALHLEERGYLKLEKKEGNRKGKYIILTEKGIEYYRNNQLMKDHLEKKIAERLGTERVEVLKALLREDWW